MQKMEFVPSQPCVPASGAFCRRQPVLLHDPAQCDAMGHMNVQYYIAAFDQSLWHLMATAGNLVEPA